MKSLLVIGTGGHAKVIAESARASGWSILGWIDESRRQGEHWNGAPVLGKTEDWLKINAQVGATPCVIAIGDNDTRRRVVETILRLSPTQEFATIIHPWTSISSSAHLGLGSVVFAGSVIQADVHISSHVIINTSCTVDHDCILGDYSSLAPGTRLGGSVKIGSGSALGVGVCVNHGITIGTESIIGTGSTVVRSIPDLVVAYGVPAKIQRSRQRGERYL